MPSYRNGFRPKEIKPGQYWKYYTPTGASGSTVAGVTVTEVYECGNTNCVKLSDGSISTVDIMLDATKDFVFLSEPKPDNVRVGQTWSYKSSHWSYKSSNGRKSSTIDIIRDNIAYFTDGWGEYINVILNPNNDEYAFVSEPDRVEEMKNNKPTDVKIGQTWSYESANLGTILGYTSKTFTILNIVNGLAYWSNGETCSVKFMLSDTSNQFTLISEPPGEIKIGQVWDYRNPPWTDKVTIISLGKDYPDQVQWQFLNGKVDGMRRKDFLSCSKLISETTELMNDSIQKGQPRLIKHPDGSKEYLLKQGAEDVRHRNDGPAYEVNGDKFWYQYGLLHREDGPAMELVNGSERWYRNGDLHREDGPAMICYNGDKYYYQNNFLHREDGPAVEYTDGNKQYYLRGKSLSEQQFLDRLDRQIDRQKQENMNNKTIIKPGQIWCLPDEKGYFLIGALEGNDKEAMFKIEDLVGKEITKIPVTSSLEKVAQLVCSEYGISLKQLASKLNQDISKLVSKTLEIGIAGPAGRVNDNTVLTAEQTAKLIKTTVSPGKDLDIRNEMLKLGNTTAIGVNPFHAIEEVIRSIIDVSTTLTAGQVENVTENLNKANLANKVISLLDSNNEFVFGGYVRDMIAGNAFNDLDIFLNVNSYPGRDRAVYHRDERYIKTSIIEKLRKAFGAANVYYHSNRRTYNGSKNVDGKNDKKNVLMKQTVDILRDGKVVLSIDLVTNQDNDPFVGLDADINGLMLKHGLVQVGPQTGLNLEKVRNNIRNKTFQSLFPTEHPRLSKLLAKGYKRESPIVVGSKVRILTSALRLDVLLPAEMAAAHRPDTFYEVIDTDISVERVCIKVPGPGGHWWINVADLVLLSESEEKSSVTNVVGGNSSVEKKMETKTEKSQDGFVAMIKDDATEAAYRVAAHQMARGIRIAALNLVRGRLEAKKLRKSQINAQVSAFEEFLDSELGEAMISGALGMVLTYAPMLKEHPKAKVMAKEFRVAGITQAGNVLMDVAVGSFLPVIMESLQSLPEPEAKVRIAAEEPVKARVMAEAPVPVVEEEDKEEEETAAVRRAPAV